MRTLFVRWGRAALVTVFVFGLLGCNPIFRIDEDPTGISEEQFAKQEAEERRLGVHLNFGGFGELIEGVVRQRDIAPQLICKSSRQGQMEGRLLDLYVKAALQAPAVQRDLFHEIEELELTNGNLSTLAWWWDREAQTYPETAPAIQQKKAALHGIDRVRAICLLTRSGYFSRAVLDDFERENQPTQVCVYCCDTSEQMLQLLQSEADLQQKFGTSLSPHAFDVVMLADFAVATLAAKGWLAPIIDDPSTCKDEFRRNLALVGKDFRAFLCRYCSASNVDLNRYCIPYCWSAIGVAYNSAFIDEIPFSWAELLNPVGLSPDRLRIRYRRTSMLLDPRRSFQTIFLYLENRRIETPTLRTVETAERLLTDLKIISEKLPPLVDDPERNLLLANLNRFLNNLRDPRGQQLEQLAAALHQLQNELASTRLRLESGRTFTTSEQSPSVANPVPSVPPPNVQSSTVRPNWLFGGTVIDSVRQLMLVSYSDFRSAFLFLKGLADLEEHVNLLLAQSESDTAAFPQSSEGENFALPGEPRPGEEYVSGASYDLREANAIRAAIHALKESLNSVQLQQLGDIAVAFSSLQRRTDALLDTSNAFSPEGKIEIAVSTLFRGPRSSKPGMTEEMVSFLLQQDRNDAALAKPETQSKIQEALSYLQTQDSYVTRFLTDSDTRTQLASGEVILAQASSADAAWAGVRNSNVRFFIPDEGAPGTVDCFVILNYGHSTAKPHITACRTFLNYLLRTENAAKMVNFSKYASTEEAAAPFIDREILNGPSYVRPLDLTKLRLLPVLGDRLRKIYAGGAAPLLPSSMLLQHPDYRRTKSLFGVLFEVQRPNVPGCSSGSARAMISDQKWDAD